LLQRERPSRTASRPSRSGDVNANASGSQEWPGIGQAQEAGSTNPHRGDTRRKDGSFPRWPCSSNGCDNRLNADSSAPTTAPYGPATVFELEARSARQPVRRRLPMHRVGGLRGA